MAKAPITFRIYRGNDLVRTETLSQDIIKIGKLSTSHLRLDDESVSRMHAVVEVSPEGEVSVIDLGSTHGTLVNGQKASRARLHDGDELRLGGTRIVVGIEAPAAAQAAAPQDQPAQATLMGVPAPPVPGAAVAGAAVHAIAAVPGAPGWIPPPVPGAAAQAAGVPAWSGGDGVGLPVDVDRPDGARTIEVAAMFGSSVIAVEQLDHPQSGRVPPLTWVRLALGAALLVAGLVMSILGQVGVAAIAFLVAIGVITTAWLRFQDDRRPPHFTIGDDPRAVFHAPSRNLPAPLFPLVHSDGHGYSLLFAAGMSGDVTEGDARTELATLAQAGAAKVSSEFANTYRWPIPDGARCKVDIGENTFLVNSVVRARPVGAGGLRGRDWTTQSYNGMSLAAHAMFLFLIFSVPPDAKSLSLDLFGTDNRFVKFLIKPPEQKDEDIPEWLKKQGPDEAGGKGQKHKGEEGKMGDKKSKEKDKLYGLKGPQENKDPHLAKRLAELAAQQAGVLGLLQSASGSHIASIFGRDSALGTDAEDALGGLIGDTIGDAYGMGGLGLVGTGRGGGGTGEGTIGLGRLGTIGKGGGGGGGAGYGRGVGRLRGRRAGAPQVIQGQALVRGSLDKEIIRRIIRRHINEVKYCYEKELQRRPDIKGRVSIQFTISGSGSVIASVVQQSTMNNPAVEQCIAVAVRRWTFPKPVGGGIVVVTYPFVLQAAGGEEE